MSNMSARRSGLRSRKDAQPQSDAGTPDATPSRKRRRVSNSIYATVDRECSQLAQPNGNQNSVASEPLRTRTTESVASNDSNTTLPNSGDVENSTDSIERQNLIIAALRTPHYTPNAAIDYANDLQARRNQGKNIAAFAKIAARDWCFFVQDTSVRIGRADSSVRPNPPDSQPNLHASPPGATQHSNWGVHIDLGPERQISRIHAEISFHSQDQKWYIQVNSRNGLKLDDRSLTRGDIMPLHSGICIGIMGTQMLFLLANTEDNFHSILWRQVRNEDAMESDNDGISPPKLHHAHPSGSMVKDEQYDPFPPSSHPRNRQKSSHTFYNQLVSTPGRPQVSTPLIPGPDKDSWSKDSPVNLARGLLMESADDIDYGHDIAKDIKPPYSYAQLIGQAILSSDEEMLTLSNIYDYIKSRYAFFRHSNGGWQNSIRHNLSLNKSFEKVARRTDEPGKGMKWKIADSEREEFIKKQLLNPRKGGGIAIGFLVDHSGPNSPALGVHRDATSQATERLIGALERDYTISGVQVKSSRSTTPPLSSVGMADESYTPDRGSNPNREFKQSPNSYDRGNFLTPARRLHNGSLDSQNYMKTDIPNRHLESSPSIDPVKPSTSVFRAEGANSPPALYSDAVTSNANGNADANRLNNALVTPLVTRHAPRLAPPSTAQMPSQYMNFSSPAPFWKFVDLPSTPAKGNLELSPIKLQSADEKDGGDEVSQPSSPPVPFSDNHAEVDEESNKNKADDTDDLSLESPSRTLSRPASRREIDSQRSRSNSNANGFGPTTNGGMVRGASLASFDEDRDAEEECYDLSKGFQKIGSFHRSMAQAHGIIGRAISPPLPRTSVSMNL